MELKRWMLATALYGLLGLSLGLYYNLTFFGAAAMPMAEPVSLLAPLLYYLAGSVHLAPGPQALAWIGSFLLAGWFWLGALELLTRRSAAWGTLLSPTLLLPPIPWLLYLHGAGPGGFSWQTCRTAILVRKFGLTPLQLDASTTGLGTVMLALGALAGGVGLFAWWKSGRRPAHYALALVAALVAVVGTAAAIRGVS